MKIKIVLEFDVREYEKEAYDGGRIYDGPEVSYRIDRAPDDVLVNFIVESVGNESDIINDHLKVVSVIRDDKEIAVVDSKIA